MHDAPATKEEFFTRLHQYTLDFGRMKPAVEYTVRDRALGVEGYVVVWNVSPVSGMAKGGCRVTPTVTIEEVGMLARTMSLKNAAAGLPLGGAKSGIRGNPNSPGFKQQYQAIARGFVPLFPENGGCFGGLGFDLGARPEFIDWFIEATGMPQRFTGKPASLGGTDYDVHGIAGLGVAASARAGLAVTGGNAEGASFAVQGLGAMGAGVVRYFGGEYGGVLRSVSDKLLGGSYRLGDDVSDAARREIVDAIARMDKPLTADLIKEHGEHIGPPGEVLYESVDVLFPCAVHDVIHPGNDAGVAAGMVAEGANGPCKAVSREALQERGVVVLPDFLVNAGGIIAAHVEMTSDAEDKVQEAKDQTVATMDRNVRRVMEMSAGLGVSPYQSASYLALTNVFADTGKVSPA
ncbi:MAG: glutamate dehydrogenase (NAD(P)+) [Pseudohongiellaceae bacterium]|jgi:glutamate dehydrogenase (NAD(P)+)